MTERIDPPFTHKVTITLTSFENQGEVAAKVVWSPDLEGTDVVALGYFPASFSFLQQYILPALEEAYLETNYKELLETPAASNTQN